VEILVGFYVVAVIGLLVGIVLGLYVPSEWIDRIKEWKQKRSSD